MRVIRGIRLALVLPMLVAVTGCSSNNKGKIEGTKWSSVATTVNGKVLPAGALALEFAKDGKLTYKAGPATFTGTYSLGSGDNVMFNMDQDLGGKGKKHQEKVKISGDKLTMTDGDGTTVDFTRVK